jgi:hypothetical protein
MTQFNIDQVTEIPDDTFAELDCRFDVALIRTVIGLEIRV